MAPFTGYKKPCSLLQLCALVKSQATSNLCIAGCVIRYTFTMVRMLGIFTLFCPLSISISHSLIQETRRTCGHGLKRNSSIVKLLHCHEFFFYIFFIEKKTQLVYSVISVLNGSDSNFYFAHVTVTIFTSFLCPLHFGL